MSEEKSVSAGSLFRTLMTRSQKKSGANIAAIWFLEQLVHVAWSLRYSRIFKEIFCIYNNKAKNKFIAPYKIS